MHSPLRSPGTGNGCLAPLLLRFQKGLPFAGCLGHGWPSAGRCLHHPHRGGRVGGRVGQVVGENPTTNPTTKPDHAGTPTPQHAGPEGQHGRVAGRVRGWVCGPFQANPTTKNQNFPWKTRPWSGWSGFVRGERPPPGDRGLQRVLVNRAGRQAPAALLSAKKPDQPDHGGSELQIPSTVGALAHENALRTGSSPAHLKGAPAAGQEQDHALPCLENLELSDEPDMVNGRPAPGRYSPGCQEHTKRTAQTAQTDRRRHKWSGINHFRPGRFFATRRENRPNCPNPSRPVGRFGQFSKTAFENRPQNKLINSKDLCQSSAVWAVWAVLLENQVTRSGNDPLQQRRGNRTPEDCLSGPGGVGPRWPGGLTSPRVAAAGKQRPFALALLGRRPGVADWTSAPRAGTQHGTVPGARRWKAGWRRSRRQLALVRPARGSG
jgi:hypothetical protein